jgi:hypothetical protein
MAYTRIRSTTQHSHPNRYAQNLISPICSPINGTQRFFLPCLSATAMPPRRAAVARRRMPISATREDYSVQNTEAATINTVWRSIHEEETWWNGPTWRYPKERGLYWSWAERMGVFFFSYMPFLFLFLIFSPIFCFTSYFNFSSNLHWVQICAQATKLQHVCKYVFDVYSYINYFIHLCGQMFQICNAHIVHF